MHTLVHIGYHKTGTTLLQRRFFPKTAKAGFSLVAGVDALQPAFVDINPFAFDPDVTRQSFKWTISRAQEQGLVPVLSYERLSGSPHAGGYDAKLIADRLAATFPEVRVLAVIRDQRAMLVSLYQVYLRMGGTASLVQYADPPPQSSARAPLFRFDFLEYHRLVGYYQGLFGAENVLVLPYELLNERPGLFLKHIQDFAGVQAGEAFEKPGKMNSSPSALTLRPKRHINKWAVCTPLNPSPVLPLRVDNESFRAALGKTDAKLPESWRLASNRSWHRLSEELIGERYAESNTRTVKLTGLDLEAFGYML